MSHASTGNTSASAAAYGAKAGLKTYVLIPDGYIALGKLSQAMMYGAEIIAIQGNFDEALEADFDGITIRVVEDAGLARKQALEIVAHRAIDFLCRRPKSFTKGI